MTVLCINNQTGLEPVFNMLYKLRMTASAALAATCLLGVLGIRDNYALIALVTILFVAGMRRIDII